MSGTPLASPIKFGVLGTGYWAEAIHARALQLHPQAELVGIWGRHPDRAAAVGSRLGATAYGDLDELLDAVDAVSIAVVPQAQPDLAIRAARAGRHVILEKPIALTLAEAERTREAIDEARVRALVFFTLAWLPATSAWITDAASVEALTGGEAHILLSNYRDDSPYRESLWRKEYGPVWDLGPHALSVLVRLLGPITEIKARHGEGDAVHITFTHRGGASSTAALSMTVNPSEVRFDASVWSEGTTTSMPPLTGSEDRLREGFGAAANELIATDAATLRRHPAGIDFAVDVVRLLERAIEAEATGEPLAVGSAV